MKTKRAITTLMLYLVAFIGEAQIKIDWSDFKQLFQNKKYQEALNKAVALRKQPYGKCLQVDYLITKCICEGGSPSQAKRCFEQLKSYAINKKMAELIKKEEENCLNPAISQNTESILSAINFLVNNKDIQPVAVSRGKIGFVLDCNKDGKNAGDFELDINLSEEEFSNRLFEISEKTKALSFYKNLLGAKYRIDTLGRFVVVTLRSHEKELDDLKRVAMDLERAYTFYTKNFELRAPDKLITVYLMGNKSALQDVALKVHHMKLPSANIGYSCLGDLSLLGTSTARSIGTLYHELFHLVVRADLGDIPAWLDEGIASLYETNSWKGDSLIGDVKNWRTMVIDEYLKTSSNRSFEYIFDKNWDAFKVSESNNLCDVTVNYAYSKHFAIYLQHKKLLKKILAVFRDQKSIFEDPSAKIYTDIELVEQCFGRKMSDIQKDYDNWFHEVYHTDLNKKSLKSDLREMSFTLDMIRNYNLTIEEKAERNQLDEQCRKYINVLENAPRNIPNISLNVSNTAAGAGNNNKNLDLEIEKFLNRCNIFAQKHQEH